MPYQTIQLNIKDGIAVVTINRPEKMNALNAAVLRELREAFEGLKADASAAAAIITGAGEKAFVAGADIGELSKLDEGTGKRFAEEGQSVFTLIETMGKPVIAAVNGFALGGGCELALACHLRIASEHARFGQPEVTLGVIPGYGGTQRLARLVGKGRAMEMILTGDAIDAAEAYRIGLANKVVPAAELMATAQTVAKRILSRGLVAVHHALRAVHMTDELSLTQGLALEASLFGDCCSTQDFKEGTQAFLEKRKPTFRGR
jgi:enoyl-CoA hydratase